MGDHGDAPVSATGWPLSARPLPTSVAADRRPHADHRPALEMGAGRPQYCYVPTWPARRRASWEPVRWASEIMIRSPRTAADGASRRLAAAGTRPWRRRRPRQTASFTVGAGCLPSSPGGPPLGERLVGRGLVPHPRGERRRRRGQDGRRPEHGRGSASLARGLPRGTGLQCGLARLIVLANALRSLREGERATADPCAGRTLEWGRASGAMGAP